MSSSESISPPRRGRLHHPRLTIERDASSSSSPSSDSRSSSLTPRRGGCDICSRLHKWVGAVQRIHERVGYLNGDETNLAKMDCWERAICNEIKQLRDAKTEQAKTIEKMQEDNDELRSALNETREQVQALLDLCLSPGKEKFFDSRKEISLLRERINAIEKQGSNGLD